MDNIDDKLTKIFPPEFRRFSKPVPLNGGDIGVMNERWKLHLTEISAALGIHTAALYSKKSSPQPLKSSVSLLLRLYAAFENKIHRVTPPDPTELINLIRQAEPEFEDYSIGPLLGLETNSSYRFLAKGLDKAAQTTRVLAWLTHDLLTEDLGNWQLIKNIVELEAAARGIEPPSSVWKNGGWSKSAALAEETKPSPRSADGNVIRGKKAQTSNVLRRRSEKSE